MSLIFSVGGFALSNQLAVRSSLVLKVINIAVSSFTSFVGILMVYGFANLIESKIDNMLWGILKKNSFGIYLFHQQLIYPCILLLNGNVYPVVQVAICLVVVICISSVITELLRKWKTTSVLFGI